MLTDELRDKLKKFEFVRLRFELNCERECELSMSSCLGLRKRLQASARELSLLEDYSQTDLDNLFDPSFKHDPVGSRRFQKPSPPFVFRFEPDSFRCYSPGETFCFELLLAGEALTRRAFFVRLIAHFAESALAEDGDFELLEVSAWDDSENLQAVWEPGDPLDDLVVPVCNAEWWVLRREPLRVPLQLRISTPARLLSRGKPLFRPDFGQIFPFMLRRATSMCYAHAETLLFDDIQPVLDIGQKIVSTCDLQWHDWRTPCGENSQDIGGVIGSCELNGEAVMEVSWLLALGELFQIGRGASYGAGKIELMQSLPA